MAAVSAIVLAAGRSARMGRPKPLVEIGGEPMLARVLAAVRASRVDEVVLVLGHEAERVRRAVPPKGATVVVNPEWEAGRSTSLRAGICAAKASAGAYLVVLGDQPFVSPSTIDALVWRWRTGSAAILVPTFRGARGNPVLLDRALAAELEALRGDVGARAIFPRHSGGLLDVPVDDPGVLVDIDSPEQVAAIEKDFAEGCELDAIVTNLAARQLSAE